ncbi:MAG: hypothetical protein V3T72_02900 [Thermoanaerobaculia bacterium]
MVSVDLLASDFVHEVELPRALERRERDAALVIPVIVRACPWRVTVHPSSHGSPPGGRGAALC